MKPKTIAHSKYKNAGILFELLVRQVTHDTITNRADSPALSIMRKYFHSGTELGKEMQLYRAVLESGKLSENKAIHFIDLVVEQRKKLSEKKLAQEKYNLIREIKQNYNLQQFLSHKIPNYVVHASIYKTFLTETLDASANIINIRDIATAKFTLIEHLLGNLKVPHARQSNALVEELKNETEDLRLLAYKMAMAKFNEKYSNLNESQRSLLREYINNVSGTEGLTSYLRNEASNLKKQIQAAAELVQVRDKNQILAIKLQEVASQLDRIGKTKVTDSHVTSLMIGYEILKEISNA